MLVLRPLKTNRLSQGWGESKACIYPNRVIVGKVNDVCPTGSQDLYRSIGLKSHNGFDNVAWYGEPIYHSADFNGWIKTEVDRAGGIGIDVVSNEPVLKCTEPNCDEIHFVKIRYWHGKEVIGHDGQKVLMGQMIMLADNTGLSSSTHLHWSPKWCDKDGRGLHRNNGFYGAFSVVPYYKNTFITDYLKNQAELKLIEYRIEEVQLTLIQILTKFIFILQEQIRKLKIGSIFR